jgi:histidinol-phosphate aminotransferase
MNFEKLINSTVSNIKPYSPGKPISELARELGFADIIKLASNENPLGPGYKVSQAIQKAIPVIARYPVGNCFELRQELSKYLDVNSEQITLGNGSNEVLTLIAKTFLNPSVEVMFSQYAFIVYKVASQITGAKIIEVPAKNWGCDLIAMQKAITNKTQVIFIANPNNPTGTLLEAKQLKEFIENIPENIIVVIDEAYHEYVQHQEYESAITWIKYHPNLIVTRSFSKAFGLAGLRIGYSISHPDIAAILNSIREPFNVNHLAQVAAYASLQDKEHLDKSTNLNQQSKEQLQIGLDALKIEYIPSVANFITINLKKPAMLIYEQLLHKGVIVRPLDGYNMPNCLRVTVGLAEENEAFLKSMLDTDIELHSLI